MRNDDYIGIRIPQNLRSALDNIAKELDMPISEIARKAIERFIAESLNSDFLKETLEDLELKLREIELDLQNIDHELSNLEKEFKVRKDRLELQRRRLQRQKAQIEDRIKLLKQRLEAGVQFTKEREKVIEGVLKDAFGDVIRDGVDAFVSRIRRIGKNPVMMFYYRIEHIVIPKLKELGVFVTFSDVRRVLSERFPELAKVLEEDEL